MRSYGYISIIALFFYGFIFLTFLAAKKEKIVRYFLLLIPYISTVVLLPILYTRWQFILEYFGDPGIRSAEVSPPPAAEQGIDRFIIRPERQSQNNGPF